MPRLMAILVLLITTFSLSVFSSPYQGIESIDQISQRKSDALFSKLMSDPFLNKAFNESQIDHLSTYMDKQLYYTFINDPVVSQTIDLIEMALAERLRLTDATNLKGMTLITPETGLDLFVSVTKVMRRLGFSEEQIKNAKIFRAKGPINAYTYGSSKDNVSFVIFDGLIEKSTRGELEGVIAHELGHILQKHMVKQMSLNLLFDRVITLAMAHHPTEGRNNSAATEAAIQEFDKFFMDRLESELSEHMTERYGFPKDEADALAKKYHVPSREALKLAKIQAEQAMQQLPPQVLIQSSQKFLLSLVEVMRFLEVPRDTMFFFSTLAKNINTAYRPNVEDLSVNLKIALNIMSREFETSADFTSVTARDPYTSVRFDIKTGGGSSLSTSTAQERLKNNAPTLRAETKKAISLIEKQLELSKSSTTSEEKNMIISTSGSTHPRDNIRALNQIFYSRNPEILMFRNPFLRFVALAHELKSKKERIDAETELYTMRKQKLPEAAKQNNYPAEDVERTLAQFDFKLAALKQELALVAPYIPQLEQIIIELINELGFEKANPRLVNYVEYVLNERQIKKSYLEELSKSKNAQNPSVAVVISNLQKQLSVKDPVIEVLQQKVNSAKALSDTGQALKLALVYFENPDTSLEAYDKLREQIRILTKSANRESRARVDLARTVKTSSDKSIAPSLDSLVGEAPAAEDHAFKALQLSQCVRSILRIVN